MIFSRRGIDINSYPSIKQHLEAFQPQLEPRPANWQSSNPDDTWHGRKQGTYAWYEIQDAVDYWHLMEGPKICIRT